jgi:hypothetical protein
MWASLDFRSADAHAPILFVPVHDSGTEVAIPAYSCAKGATILAAIKTSENYLMPLVTSGGPRLKKNCIKLGSQRMDACWRTARPGPLLSNRHARHEQSNGCSQRARIPDKVAKFLLTSSKYVSGVLPNSPRNQSRRGDELLRFHGDGLEFTLELLRLPQRRGLFSLRQRHYNSRNVHGNLAYLFWQCLFRSAVIRSKNADMLGEAKSMCEGHISAEISDTAIREVRSGADT